MVAGGADQQSIILDRHAPAKPNSTVPGGDYFPQLGLGGPEPIDVGEDVDAAALCRIGRVVKGRPDRHCSVVHGQAITEAVPAALVARVEFCFRPVSSVFFKNEGAAGIRPGLTYFNERAE